MMADNDIPNLPPGSNAACHDSHETRVRRDWYLMGDGEKATYLDAVETAVERGLHQRFAVYHSDTMSDMQAHETCAFFLWHRRFLLSYENMLRSLEPRFACLTVPYWNIMTDYQLQTTDHCKSYATCGDLPDTLGGFARTDEVFYRQFNGREMHGLLHDRSPIQNLRDDWNLVGIVRDDLWFGAIPPTADRNAILDAFNKSGSDQLQLWREIHAGLHDDVHNTVGGFMRTPSSPIDPVFFPWHSMVDLFGYLWELCHLGGGGGGGGDGDGGEKEDVPERTTSDCLYTDDARNTFSSFAFATGEIHVGLGFLDVRDDSMIGKYFRDDLGLNFSSLLQVTNLDRHFRYTYEISDLELRKHLVDDDDSKICPAGGPPFANVDREVASILANATSVFQHYSATELLSIREIWVQEAREYWTNPASYPDTSEQLLIERNLQFVKCLLDVMDHDTLERWAIDNAFLEQVVRQQNVGHPKCDFLKNKPPSESLAPKIASSSFHVEQPFWFHSTVGWALLLAYLICR